MMIAKSVYNCRMPFFPLCVRERGEKKYFFHCQFEKKITAKSPEIQIREGVRWWEMERGRKKMFLDWWPRGVPSIEWKEILAPLYF